MKFRMRYRCHPRLRFWVASMAQHGRAKRHARGFIEIVCDDGVPQNVIECWIDGECAHVSRLSDDEMEIVDKYEELTKRQGAI